MTTITTMQELRDLPDGTTVDIQAAGTRRWVKQADRLTAGDMSLGLIAFEGQVAAGHMSVGSRFTVGDLYRTHRGDHYYIAGLYPDERDRTRRVLLGVIVGAGQSITFARYGEDVNIGNATLLSQDDRPEWYPFCERMSAEHVRAEDLQQQVSGQGTSTETEELRARVAQLTRDRDSSQAQLGNLVEALEGWAREHDVEDISDNGDLRDLFADFYITWQRTETITVTVDIDGVTETDFEDHVGGNSAVEEIIQSSRLADWSNTSVSEVTLEWTASFDRDVEVQSGTCACGEVDRDDVRQWLDDSGFNYSDFSYTNSCENC